ncbi:nuclease-related domain-containing protein [Siminovitchia terrae]|uniref:nuclease-related domain-containing protein n=1 Tax=Siminovitchia terrae TaxID=1914933 RepID=UPI001BB2FA1A|nr:nuclease-related domain-containing protein [Siminovitchia terrae]
MVKKARAVPLRILVLEALLRRLPIDHPGRGTIEADLIRRKAGFKGEQSLDYFMRHLPFNGHYIFQDLRLPLSDNIFFQIDSLLLSNRYFIRKFTRSFSQSYSTS